MPVLNVSHKGHSLRLVFSKNSYYTRQKFKPGKTLYQILFEHLVDGKPVSMMDLARKYKKVNLFIGSFTVGQLMKVIETALKKSKDKRLREMRFTKLHRIGKSFTPKQRKIIESIMRKMHSGGKMPSNNVVRDACLNALRQRNLAGNIIFGSNTVRKFKQRFGLPLRPQPPHLKHRRMP